MAFKEHTGTVVKIENRRMFIQFGKQLGCHACEHKDSCGITEESNVFDFDLIDGIDVGDTVKVYIEDKTVLKSALLVYILPIAILLVFAIIGGIITKIFSFSEIFTPAFSLFGVIIYFILLKMVYGKKKIDIKIEKV
ncbi:SoxR reducing system RseC family protein [Deferribacter autotrophicus]|uniref:SoxR reducing system RseC family protein n=1 Tax=Deferribacter autotrophicus TaxID=500465 RepID=A0A5A8F420_9BACT|nr:SoxR reducing system RseC family protein [Deferribacter autotrophicus]KAA0258638.1 SoxR reducing system RseC family protein [Deferribacter autotrophicus]